MIETILLVVSILLNVFLAVTVFRALGKVEALQDSNSSYEEYFGQLQFGLKKTLEEMRLVDVNGAFETDDEVGLMFTMIKGMVNSLDAYVETEA